MAVSLLLPRPICRPPCSNSISGSDVPNSSACTATVSMASSSAPALMSSLSSIFSEPSCCNSHPLVASSHHFSLAGALSLQRKLLASERKWVRLRPCASKSHTSSSSREVIPQTSRGGTQLSSSYEGLSRPRSSKAEEEIRNEVEVKEEEKEKEEEEQIPGSGNGVVSRKEGEVTESHSSAAKEEEVPEGGGEDSGLGGGAAIGSLVAGLGLIAVLGGFGALGFFYREQINAILIQFSDFIEGYGPAGYGLFVLVYAGLEVLAIPAIPLTMSAGLLFGTGVGTMIVSIAGTIAATGAFLIARYLARDRILSMAKNNKRFLAIDKAIGEDGFRVVTLLRLSPLLPFSLGNYLYGLTSVKLGPYVLGSWLGMLPGTWAYVSAGAIGRAFIKSESEQLFTGSPEQLWTLGLGLAATIFAATYVTRIAKEALKDVDD